MHAVKNFAVIGGDMRQLMVAESLLSDGHNVKICGFEKPLHLETKLEFSSLQTAIEESDYIILPLPVIYKGKLLNAPFAFPEISIDQNFFEMLKNKIVFCGMSNALMALDENFSKISIHDYYEREDFAILNALPTAEGAIHSAMNEYNKTINSSRCLITGFGRIGKVLAMLLKNMGANVTVSARKLSDLAWIQVMGYKAVKTHEIYKDLEYDIIFNTIPSLVFDYNTLLRCPEKSIIIDLASRPGGVDFDSAKELGIRAIHALSLPGKFAPYSAGEIIKKTIYNIIEEGNL